MRLASDIWLARRPAAAFAALGTGWGGFAALVPQVKGQIGASDATYGAALTVAALGLAFAMAVAPRLDARLGRLALPAAVAVFGLAWTLPAAAGSVAPFAAALFVVAALSGICDVVMNARVSEAEARTGRPLMNAAHGCFSVAYAAAALAVGVLREAQIAPALIMLAPVSAILALALATPTEVEAQQEGAGGGGRLPFGPIAMLGGITLIAFMTEGSIEQWSALHVERTLGGGAAEGAFGPVMLGATMAVGRFGGQAVTAHASNLAVIVAASILTALGAFVAGAAPTPLAAYLGFGLLGLGVSVMAPMALAETGARAAPGTRTRAISTVAVVGFAGFFIGPPLMGLVSELVSLPAAISMLGLIALIAAALAAALRAQPVSQRQP